MKVLCRIADCSRVMARRGLCRKHFDADPDVVRWSLQSCKFLGCSKSTSGRTSTYCNNHRKLVWQRELPECKSVGCSAKIVSKTTELCILHHNAGNGKIGNVWTSKAGYRVVYAPGSLYVTRKDGQIFEHVLVMCNHLGRKLYKDENVHHINGVKTDNRIDNLELWSTSQPPGQRVLDKLQWAKELISRYEN